MRKLIVSMMVSADGFVEGENNDLYWHTWDEEMEKYMTDFIGTVDTFLYGRKSYELMLQYWPSAKGAFADLMNETPKIVFSQTLKKAEWNSRLIKDNIGQQILQLKQQPGKDMVLFAGADILSTFIQLGLVDEYRLIVNPVALGKGNPLFKNLDYQLGLKLAAVNTVACGNAILTYLPAMMKKEQLINVLEDTSEDLLKTLSGYSAEQINSLPFEGSWTAGQVTEHVLKSLSGTPEILLGSTKATERPADAKAGTLQAIFMDFTSKMQSPDFILPSAEPKEKEALINSIQKVMTEMTRIAGVVDLSETCTSFALPQMGELTRYEWIWFAVCHTKRHINQLKNIHEKLSPGDKMNM